MLSVGRPDNTSVRTGFSSLIRLTRSDNYIKCNKKLVYPIITFDHLGLSPQQVRQIQLFMWASEVGEDYHRMGIWGEDENCLCNQSREVFFYTEEVFEFVKITKF